jgi:hypothetical protein
MPFAWQERAEAKIRLLSNPKANICSSHPAKIRPLRTLAAVRPFAEAPVHRSPRPCPPVHRGLRPPIELRPPPARPAEATVGPPAHPTEAAVRPPARQGRRPLAQLRSPSTWPPRPPSARRGRCSSACPGRRGGPRSRVRLVEDATLFHCRGRRYALPTRCKCKCTIFLKMSTVRGGRHTLCTIGRVHFALAK